MPTAVASLWARCKFSIGYEILKTWLCFVWYRCSSMLQQLDGPGWRDKLPSIPSSSSLSSLTKSSSASDLPASTETTFETCRTEGNALFSKVSLICSLHCILLILCVLYCQNMRVIFYWFCIFYIVIIQPFSTNTVLNVVFFIIWLLHLHDEPIKTIHFHICRIIIDFSPNLCCLQRTI